MPEVEEVVEYRTKLALKTLEDAQVLLSFGSTNSCVSRCYFACFYAVSALMATINLKPKTHKGLHILFKRHFVETGLLEEENVAYLHRLFLVWLRCDHEMFYEMNNDEARQWLDDSESFVHEILECIACQTRLSE